MKTQYKAVLEVMQNNFRKWLPAYYFVGVKMGIDGKVFLSYKAPTRLSEIYKDYSDQIQRRPIKDNGKYFEYKMIKKILV